MQVNHILLGRLWLYYWEIHHGGREAHTSFSWKKDILPYNPWLQRIKKILWIGRSQSLQLVTKMERNNFIFCWESNLRQKAMTIVVFVVISREVKESIAYSIETTQPKVTWLLFDFPNIAPKICQINSLHCVTFNTQLT